MRRIWDIAVLNLRLLASDRAAFLWLLLMPLVFTVVMSLAIGGGRDADAGPVRYALTVQNLDEGRRGQSLLDAIAAADEIDLIPLEGDADEAERLVAEGERSSALVIPHDFSEALDAGGSATLIFHRNPERMNPLATRKALDAVVARLNVEMMVETAVPDAYESLGRELDGAREEQLIDEAKTTIEELWASPPISVATETLGRPPRIDVPEMGFSHFSPSMALMFVLLNGLFTSVALVGERRERTLARLFTCPVRRSQIIGANFAWRFLVGIFQMWFLIAVGAFVFRVDWGDAPLALALVTIAYVAAVAALSVLVGSTARTERQAESVAMVAALTMCAMGGLWWPLEITPESYQIIGHLIPTGWGMDAMHNIVSRGYTAAQTLPQIIVLLGFASAFTAVAVLAFRHE